MSNEKMELKAYKLLAEIRGSLLNQIIHDAKNKIQYKQDDIDELRTLAEYISNPKKWDYTGYIHKEDIKVMEVLEFLLNDDQEKIIPYKEWTPPKYD